ncbi:MAG: phasin family protein [Chloroflexota bacterium]
MTDEQIGANNIEPNPIRRLWLAGIGAAAIACDTAEQTFDQFVNRGEEVETEGRERASSVRERSAGRRNRMENTFQSGIDTVLNTLNLPSKSDLDAINTKLNIVNRKLDDIQLERVETGEAPPTPVTPLTEDEIT